jgi:hypothetical protein
VAQDANNAEAEGNAAKNETQQAGDKNASHASSSKGFVSGGKGKARNKIPKRTTRPVSYSKKPLVCWSCGCTGHPARLCPDRQPPNGRFRPPAEPSDANHAVTVNDEVFTFTSEPQMALAPHAASNMQAECGTADVTEELLYDSGCNMHLTSRRDLLHDFMPVPKAWPQSVAWGNESSSDMVRGVGSLIVKVGDRYIRIDKVSLVKNARRTLLCSKLLHRQTGTHPRIDEPNVEDGLYDQSEKIVIPLDCMNDLQFLRGVAEPSVAQASHANGVLWHERLTHPGLEKIKALQQKGLVPTLTGTPATKGECKGCAVGKATCTARESAPDDRQPLGIGERLHVDIAFPSVEGRRGEKCVLTTLDEGSRFVRVFLLATKGQAADEII